MTIDSAEAAPGHAGAAGPAAASPGRSRSQESSRLIGAGATARLLRPVREHVIASVVLSALGAAAGVAPYVAIVEIARAVLGAPSLPAVGATVWTWAGVGAGGALLRLVLLGFASDVGHYADAKLLHHLRARIVRRLGVVPLGWFRAVGSGQVKKAMTDDLEEMHHLIAHALGEYVAAGSAVAVTFAYLAFVDWRMALITLAVLAALLMSYRVAMRSMSTHLARLTDAEGRISTASVEYADGITVVKTFGAGGKILDRFRAAVREQTEAFGAWASEVRYSSAICDLLSSEMTVLAVVLFTGLSFAGTGSLGIVDLLAFVVVGIGVPTALTPMMRGAQGLRKARLAAGRLEYVLSREQLPEPDVPVRPVGNRIEFDDVTFSYDGASTAVEGVDLTCEPGTLTALVGPSGAGKSTLASLLPRFYDVSGGAIRIGGADLRDISPEVLLSSMSLVFQDVVLLRDTVLENIRIGRPGAADEEVREAAERANIHHVIEQLPQGYDTMLGSGAGGLSGGEQQRLTIARAILSGAPIVVLDEATAALDPDSESAVQDALSDLAVGKTVIVIAHRLHTIRDADRIVVLDTGSVAETGTHDELLGRDGLYARMWRAQQNGDRA